MARLIGAFLAVCLAPGFGAAQTWQSTAADSGALVSAAAFAPQYSLSIFCNAPSFGGRNPIETGEHETQRTDPYTLVVSFSAALVDPLTAPPVLEMVTLTVDGTGYRLPPVPYDEFFGSWSVTLPLTDFLFAPLTNAQELLFDPGLGTAYAYPTDGLTEAMARMTETCVSAWFALGHPLPPELDANRPAAAAPLPLARMEAVLYDDCEGGYTLDAAGGVTETELNGDGIPDVILFYGAVNCASAQGYGAGYCGASQCLTAFFVSGGSGPADHVIYSQAVLTDPARPRQIGLAARLAACQQMGLMPDCVAWYAWRNGTLERTN